MVHEIKIPSLGESIVSGVITQWSVQDGDFVKEGDLLYELETDKITSEGISEFNGKIQLLAEVEDEVEIGQVVAKIDDSVGQEQASESTDPTETSAAVETSESDAVYPPSVERLAALSDIDPNTVEGTGKDGRVTKGDMLAAESHPTIPTPEAPVAESPVEVKIESSATITPIEEPAKIVSTPSSDVSGKRTTRKKMTPLRKKIAERLVSVKNEAAILTTFNEVDMSAVMKLRKEMQDDFVGAHGVKLGFMSFFTKAVVNALKAVPSINAQIEGNEIVTNHFYDIGVAVGTEKGLIVPVVRDCDKLSFNEIETQLLGYAQKAREGKIAVDDLQGGVFTISNGGVYGSLLSTPIINPPQSGILGMHSIQERPVAIDGEVVIRPMMYIALSYDHRIVDGKEAVTFLINVKKSIENPSRLLFGI